MIPELTDYQKALHLAHYKTAWELEEEAARLRDPAEIKTALRRASISRRIGCNSLNFPQSEHKGSILTSFNLEGVVELFGTPMTDVLGGDLPYIAGRVTEMLPPEMRNGGIKGYEIVRAA